MGSKTKFSASQAAEAMNYMAMVVKNVEMFIDRYKAGLVKDTSYKGFWNINFTLKEF